MCPAFAVTPPRLCSVVLPFTFMLLQGPCYVLEHFLFKRLSLKEDSLTRKMTRILSGTLPPWRPLPPQTLKCGEWVSCWGPQAPVSEAFNFIFILEGDLLRVWDSRQMGFPFPSCSTPASPTLHAGPASLRLPLDPLHAGGRRGGGCRLGGGAVPRGAGNRCPWRNLRDLWPGAGDLRQSCPEVTAFLSICGQVDAGTSY